MQIFLTLISERFAMIDAPHAHGPREELLSIWPAEEPLAVSLQPRCHKNHFKSAWYNGTLLVTIGRLLNNFLLHLGFGSASATLDYWTKGRVALLCQAGLKANCPMLHVCLLRWCSCKRLFGEEVKGALIIASTDRAFTFVSAAIFARLMICKQPSMPLLDFFKTSVKNLQLVSQVQEEKAMGAVPQCPIETSKFLAFVQERKRKRLLFKGELMMLKQIVENHKSEYGYLNLKKNNYPDVLPFDYNRVILKPIPNEPNSHYINASYVDSFFQPKAFIITQAVKTKPACVDFWRMVWETNAEIVVMLTKVFDFMKVMCLQYWPLTKFDYGDITVETVEAKTYAYFTLRCFRVSRVENGSTIIRQVRHFHFTEWEVNSLPYISALLDFRRRVHNAVKRCPNNVPMIVHCSNGGGRSGVFLAIYANLDLAEAENVIDVYGYCQTLLNARQSALENLDQYVFIYDTLAEAVQCNINPLTLEELRHRTTMYTTKQSRQALEAIYSQEYKFLTQLTPALRIGDCAGGHRLENRGKNRDVMVVPPDNSRPYLNTLHGESKDYTYINAVYVDGFRRKNEWIVTEWPKHHTIDSFWALVFDHSCHTVVNLSNDENSKAYPRFIHSRGRQSYGPFIVDVLSSQQYPYATSHIVKVVKKKVFDIPGRKKSKRSERNEKKLTDQLDSLASILSELMVNNKGGIQEVDARICNVISVRIWPIQHRVPLSTVGLIDVIKMARCWRKRAPDRPETKPTVVISHNGVSRVGIYVAINLLIDQMDVEQEVDVFHAAKIVRLNRPQLFDHKEEYKYLNDLLIHYYMTSPEYHSTKSAESPCLLVNHS
ncbi:Receptor-type tyrosine-protein phosphatase mu [Trichinella britovi]|uniref:Receptor-type tyrosine-protein phosphatase mu n=1 Tax=Trichinella britovi TaxID=45882 RepID=A0A0V1D7Z8_TRIBR|nr:Receptor-type tyrosine-protein phosphatase mu [Trichinella sp. T9]KRX74574.1 Receptor-type tyrosine-protein phosphatase mu [Trichinella sp. T6]KRY57693.1 Receptor-type tyrosine-protein phosphatase mu [Trichinella britovi]KRZ90532.1 Receptor-type tyrosine-protein phosphatase mu [Trichinella sp. T8]